MTQSTWVQDIASEAQTNSNKEWQDMIRKNEIGCELHIGPCRNKGLNRKVRWKLLPQKTSTSLKELSDWFLGISGERHPQYDHCHSWVDERIVYCLHMFHQRKLGISISSWLFAKQPPETGRIPLVRHCCGGHGTFSQQAWPAASIVPVARLCMHRSCKDPIEPRKKKTVGWVI